MQVNQNRVRRCIVVPYNKLEAVLLATNGYFPVWHICGSPKGVANMQACRRNAVVADKLQASLERAQIVIASYGFVTRLSMVRGRFLAEVDEHYQEKDFSHLPTTPLLRVSHALDSSMQKHIFFASSPFVPCARPNRAAKSTAKAHAELMGLACMHVSVSDSLSIRNL